MKFKQFSKKPLHSLVVPLVQGQPVAEDVGQAAGEEHILDKEEVVRYMINLSEIC